MRTLITSLVVAVGAAAYAQQDATVAVEEPRTHVQSAYEECLLIAGAKSWEALGLSADQVVRVTELQTRYAQGVQEAKDNALAKEKAPAKSKKQVATKVSVVNSPVAEHPVAQKPEPAVSKNAVVPVEHERIEEMITTDGLRVQEPSEADAGSDMDDAAAEKAVHTTVSSSPYDDELRAIFTPEQMTIWDRRCDSRTSMAP